MSLFKSPDDAIDFLRKARAAGVRQVDVSADGALKAVIDPPIPPAPAPKPAGATDEEPYSEDDLYASAGG